MNHKNILITGASSGIGKACATYFAKQGAKLILCARREEKLNELAQELKLKFQTESLVIKLDVTNKNEVENKFQNLSNQFLAIDVIINNAGLAAGLDKFQEADLNDWEQMLDTNIKGLLYITRALLPGMLARNTGHIINISSIAAHEVYPRGSIYCASKHAVAALTRGLRMDLLGSKIRVSAISPGLVETEFSLVRFKSDAEKASQVYKGLQPLTAEDVADAVGYCVNAPQHVNIDEIILMPVAQASAAYIYRSQS